MFELNGRQYETDKHEYLAHFDEWSPELAEYIATLENIELTDAHWEVVHFVREFYQTYDTSPAMRVLVKAIGQSLGPDKANSMYLYKLFPKGPAKQATRIAGLPKPAKCI
ncbi:TusE/DsrC/DsvC family sulfur relay protein [Pseudidiomarina marina]|uniref:Sulfurtransferase n=1 Tax=Pseudidiomarina marina TaxID=502366 RepID=A0A432YJJ2_9GAMM|nr:TusE/DsrC/DsvC family sulfur relay protein [Pseudidiomarina marina]PHR66895.1 MAG: sulfurtransferase TusE [Idiomarina sp.]RUO61159.1 sulfurtransferase TusE [Pseudidiomarina marina]